MTLTTYRFILGGSLTFAGSYAFLSYLLFQGHESAGVLMAAGLPLVILFLLAATVVTLRDSRREEA